MSTERNSTPTSSLRSSRLRGAAPLASALVLAACGATSPAPVIKSFAASHGAILEGGGLFLLFEVAGADKVTIDPGVGEVTGRTSFPVSPTVTTTYTLTATNAGGSVTATAVVEVTPLAAAISALNATPDSVREGQTVTLAWTAAHLVSQTLTADPDPGEPMPALAPATRTVEVHPKRTTVYRLTVEGRPGTVQPAPQTVAVAVAGIPAVTLSSDVAQVARGGAATLSWTRSVAISFMLAARPHGAPGPVVRSPVVGLATQVRPLADTDYTIEALGPGGTGTSNTVAITLSGDAATALHYTAPTPAAGAAVALVQRAGTSDGAVLTLDLVTLKEVAASGLALELPFDGALVGSRAGAVRAVLDEAAAGDATPGLTVNAVEGLDPGTAPAAAIAALPAAGPSAGVLLLGLAQKPVCQGATCSGGVGADRPLAAGTRLASVRLKLVPSAGPGQVFGVAALDAAHGFRSLLSTGAGAALGTIAVGTLVAR